MPQMLNKINRLINKIEIVLGLKSLSSCPIDVQIEPTNRCNQRCVMCPRNSKLDVPIGDMSLEDFKKIINKLPFLKRLQLNGLGEPLLNKDLPKMIAFANSLGVSTSINSNCALVTQSLANELIDSGLNLIKVSMDSPDEEVYQSIRGASLSPVIKGIETLMRVKKQRKANHPHVWFNSIIMRKNYNQLFDILRLGEHLKVNLVRFKSINASWLLQGSQLTVEKDKLKNIIIKTLVLAKSIKVNHNLDKILDELDTCRRSDKKIPCYSPWLELYIQYYGGVRLCCEFYSKKYDIGNILKEDFKKIWNGSKMRQIRKEFKKGNTFFDVCKDCNRFQKNISIYKKIDDLKHFRYKKNNI